MNALFFDKDPLLMIFLLLLQ